MKLYTKLILSLIACLLIVIALAQIFQYFNVKKLVASLSASNIRLLKEREEAFAKNIFASVERAVAGSLERGEMEKFTRLLSDQREIEGLLEFSLHNRNGMVTHSSDPSFLNKDLPENIKKELGNNPKMLLRWDKKAIEIYKPQMVNGDCVRCHLDWKAGEIGGITHFRFSLESLALAEAHAEQGISDARRASIMNSIFWAIVIVLVLVVAMYFLTNRLVAYPLQKVSVKFRDIANRVFASSEHFSSASGILAEGASNQAATVEETSSSLEEMSSMTKQNAENTRHADQLTKEAGQMVDHANSSMNELTVSMDEISKSGEETSKIIKMIDEIAFQTNLLALNAAVEAARAGQAGAGFAVVADEVRNLAMRTADAAKNTEELIEGTVRNLKHGSDLVAGCNEAFTQVAKRVSRLGELIDEIAAASGEQAQGIGQTNKAVAEMDNIIQQNAANAEESASASEEMSSLSVQMKKMVEDLEVLIGGRAAQKNAPRMPVVPRAKEKRTIPEKKIALQHVHDPDSTDTRNH
jgi:methyl-accepting chemotaxis protein